MGKKDKFFKTALTELPKFINTKGKSYKLESSHGNSKMFGEWWSFQYKDKDEPEMPIQVSDGSSIYYLCSMQNTEDKAKEDMLERLNTMVEVMTEEDIKEQSRLWKERIEEKESEETYFICEDEKVLKGKKFCYCCVATCPYCRKVSKKEFEEYIKTRNNIVI